MAISFKISQLVTVAVILLLMIFNSYSQTSVWAWGDNEFGQAGNGVTTPLNTQSGGISTPYQIPNFSNVVMITTGPYVSLFLKNDGTVWYCGRNDEHSPVSTPAQISGLTNIVFIASSCGYAGDHITNNFAIKNDGTVWGWGANSGGALGNGTTSSSPVGQVAGLSNIVSIAAGRYHMLALKNDGTIWDCGWDYHHVLGGNGSGLNLFAKQIDGISQGVAQACGIQHSLVLKKDGTVWAWGDNASGQFGNGTFYNSYQNDGIGIPSQTPGLYSVQTITCNGYYSLAVNNDGTVWEWGNDFTPYQGYVVPTQLTGFANVISASAGNIQRIALKNNATCWVEGGNYNAQLGSGQCTNGVGTNQPIIQTNGVDNVISIATGYAHCVALAGSSPVTFTGKIKLRSWAGGPLQSVYVTVDNQAEQLLPVTNSPFTLPLTPGSHVMRVRANGFLGQKKAVLAGQGAAVTNFYGSTGIGLIAGDLNNDNFIDDTDLLTVINNFIGTGPDGDTNGDGFVDDTDLITVINNFLATGDV